MKKAIALAVCMVLIPFTAFSLEMVTDEEMDNITGQSGVAITVDDVVIHNSGDGEMWYQNSFQVDGTGDQAAVGLVDAEEMVESMMYVNALTGVDADGFTSPGNWGPQGEYSTLFDGGFKFTISSDQTVNDFSPSPLTIRVRDIRAEDVENSAFAAAFDAGGHTDASVDAVIIGLPTVEIYEEGTVTAKEILMTDAGNPVTGADSANTYSFGTLYTGGESSMAVLDGQIEITPYNAYNDAY